VQLLTVKLAVTSTVLINPMFPDGRTLYTKFIRLIASDPFMPIAIIAKTSNRFNKQTINKNSKKKKNSQTIWR
jgi:hypothetical protein